MTERDKITAVDFALWCDVWERRAATVTTSRIDIGSAPPVGSNRIEIAQEPPMEETKWEDIPDGTQITFPGCPDGVSIFKRMGRPQRVGHRPDFDRVRCSDAGLASVDDGPAVALRPKAPAAESETRPMTAEEKRDYVIYKMRSGDWSRDQAREFLDLPEDVEPAAPPAREEAVDDRFFIVPRTLFIDVLECGAVLIPSNTEKGKRWHDRAGKLMRARVERVEERRGSVQLPPAAGTGSKDQSPAVVSIDPERLTTGDAIPWATGYQMRDDVANERLPSDQPKPAPATCPACVAGKDDDSLPFGGHTCGLYVGHEKWISVEEARAQWEKKLAPLSDPRWDLDDGDAP